MYSQFELLEIIFLGHEEKIIDHYRKLYNSGIEPNLFLNDFLEILTVEIPNQESAPTQTEPMVAQGEGMMMNRPPVQETAPAQV